MTERDFCYWLQGLLELDPKLKTLDAAQVRMVRKHLGYVFEHQTAPTSKPQSGADATKTVKDAMEKINKENIGRVVHEYRPLRIC